MSLEDFLIQTGREMIRLSKSCIGVTEKNRVLGVLDREYLGMGDEVKEFEDNLSGFFGRRVACVVNGTAALHLALQGAGVEPGDEVLVQSLTYVASFQAITAAGAKPVPCDVSSATVTIDLDDAKRRLTSKTKAVMPVHYTGGIGNLDDVNAFAREKGLRVIEDAAHAFGTRDDKGQLVGSFGDVACFSFDGIKNITSGEGGCVVAHDKEVLEQVRNARLLGVEKDTERRFQSGRSWEFDVVRQGWRFHMSNIMAAIGIEQLKRFPKLAAKRQTLAKRYVQRLDSCPWVELLDIDFDRVVPHIFVVKLRRGGKEGFQKSMAKVGVQTGSHYLPNHLLTFFKDSAEFPATMEVFPRLVSLPLHPDLSAGDVDFVCDQLYSVLKDA